MIAPCLLYVVIGSYWSSGFSVPLLVWLLGMDPDYGGHASNLPLLRCVLSAYLWPQLQAFKLLYPVLRPEKMIFPTLWMVAITQLIPMIACMLLWYAITRIIVKQRTGDELVTKC